VHSLSSIFIFNPYNRYGCRDIHYIDVGNKTAIIGNVPTYSMFLIYAQITFSWVIKNFELKPKSEKNFLKSKVEMKENPSEFMLQWRCATHRLSKP